LINSSSKTRRLVVIIVILLITNLAILAYFLWPKSGADESNNNPKQGYGLMESLKREVGLDSVQLEELGRLRSEHWKKMRPLFEDLHTSKNNFYILLKSPETPDSVINAAASRIGEKQKLIDLQVFSHFRTSRLVCTPEQRPKYDSLVQLSIKKMAGPSKNNRNRDSKDKK
jgi:periplasmic protein CpxP/Spy